MRQTDPSLLANRNVLNRAGVLAASLLLVVGCSGKSSSNGIGSVEQSAPVTGFPSSSTGPAPATPAPTVSIPKAALEAPYPACRPAARDTAISNFNEGYGMYVQAETALAQPARNADAIRSVRGLGAVIINYQAPDGAAVQRYYFDKTGFFQETTDSSLNNVDVRYVYNGGHETGVGCTVLSFQVHPSKSAAKSPSSTDFDVNVLGVKQHALRIGQIGSTISQADGTPITPQAAADLKLVTQFAGLYVALAAK